MLKNLCPQSVTCQINVLESVCQTEVGRNIGALAQHATGGLAAAARSIVATEHAHVVILTGTYIPWASSPAAETDGPPGAAILAAGLRELGVPVRLLTDKWCAPVIAAVAAKVAPGVPIDVCTDSFSVDRLARRYETLGVTHLVTVERIGPSVDGTSRNFRGEDISAFTTAFHSLLAAEQPWTTISIGDGGNELGMGNVSTEIVARGVRHGAQLHCVVGCDHLIVSGVSNWGALALLLSVEALRGGGKGKHANAERHRVAVRACVDAGAVDGTSGRGVVSVDGLAWQIHDGVIGQLASA